MNFEELLKIAIDTLRRGELNPIWFKTVYFR